MHLTRCDGIGGNDDDGGVDGDGTVNDVRSLCNFDSNVSEVCARARTSSVSSTLESAHRIDG